MNKDQNDEAAERGWRVPKHHLFKTHPHNKVDHHGYTREKEAARHAFAIEHEEEREVNQGRTRFFLRHNEDHGQYDHQAGGGKMLPVIHGKAVSTHQFGHG